MPNELFVRGIRLSERNDGAYPFTVPAIQNMGEPEFLRPITVFSGDNGSGKTTLLEMIATTIRASRISGAAIDDKGRRLAKASKYWRVSRGAARQRGSFLFSAEDFTRYIEWTERERAEARAELSRISAERGDDPYMSMPHRRTLNELEGMYSKELNKLSHGQGFLDFFKSRLGRDGCYLLDEPEGALTFENQYLLSVMMLEAVKDGCQFIVSTHSPIIAAIPNADILYFSENGIERRSYEQLENIRFLEMFMQRRRVLFDYDDGD